MLMSCFLIASYLEMSIIHEQVPILSNRMELIFWTYEQFTKIFSDTRIRVRLAKILFRTRVRY